MYRIRVPTTIGDEAVGETNYVSTFTRAVSTINNICPSVSLREKCLSAVSVESWSVHVVSTCNYDFWANVKTLNVIEFMQMKGAYVKHFTTAKNN